MTSREMIRTLGDLRAKISDKAEETKAKMIAQKATLVAKGAPLECDTFGTKSPCKCKTCWLQTLQDHQKMYAAYLKKFDRLQKLLKNQISRRRAKVCKNLLPPFDISHYISMGLIRAILLSIPIGYLVKAVSTTLRIWLARQPLPIACRIDR